MRTYIYGTPSKPSTSFELSFDEKGQPKDLNLKDRHARRFFVYWENFIPVEFQEHQEVTRERMKHLTSLVTLWNRGRLCSKEHQCRAPKKGKEVVATWTMPGSTSSSSAPDPETALPPFSYTPRLPHTTTTDPWEEDDIFDEEDDDDGFGFLDEPQSQMEEAENEEDSTDPCEYSWVLPSSHWHQFQLHADAFFMLFVLRFGENAVFKYLHSLGAGHFSEQGKKYGNLAVFAQQAVESVQGEHTAFVAHCTQRGGEVGKHRKLTNTNQDLIRWTQRRLVYPLIEDGTLEKPEILDRKSYW